MYVDGCVLSPLSISKKSLPFPFRRGDIATLMDVEDNEVDVQTRRRPRRRRREDHVVPTSIIPLIPRVHRIAQMVSCSIPILDANTITQETQRRIVAREVSHLDTIQWVWQAGITPRPPTSDSQCLLRAALRQHWVNVMRGQCHLDGNMCLVEFADQSLALTKDTEGLDVELAFRAAYQPLTPGATDITISPPTMRTVDARRIVGSERVVEVAARVVSESTNDKMERHACLTNLVRLRTSGEPAPELPAPYRVTHALPSDRRTAFMALCEEEEGSALEGAAFVDGSLLFCVERDDNPYMSSLLMLSEITPRMGHDIVSTKQEVWRCVISAMTQLTTQRVFAMYDIGRAERSPRMRLQMGDVTKRRMSWYCGTPLPSDVLGTMAALPYWANAASEYMEEHALTDWGSFELLAVQHSGVLSQLSVLRDGPEGEQCLEIIVRFLNGHKRTMRSAELFHLLPRI